MSAPIDPTVAPQSEPLRFPCSATQEQFWFLDRMSPGDPALNVALRWNVEGTFSAASFQQAFRGVIARHEILRTRFVEHAGRPMQEVVEDVAFRLAEIDIRTTPEAEQPARIDQIAGEAAAQPFDLTKPCQMRVVLIRLGNDRAVLAITVHHICFDGWSIGVLGREIGALAAAIDAGRTETLDPLPLQFGDYAMWQRSYLESDVFAAKLASARERLKDAPYFEVPPDFPRPLQRSTTCGRIELVQPPEWGARLKSEAQARGMSTFAYGAGVLSAMLSRYVDASEVLIGSQVAGRHESDLEPMIGVFINHVVLRFPTALQTTLGDHLDRASGVVLDALSEHDVPFSKLVETLNPPRDPSRTPLVSVNFILHHDFMETAQYGGFKLSSAPSHAPGALHDLNFTLIGQSSGWRITLDYNTDMFDPATADDLMVLLQASFDVAFNNPTWPLARMPAPQHGPGARQEDAQQLGRLETGLKGHPLVDDAAVVPYSQANGSRALHAFVTLAADAPSMPLEALPALLHDYLNALHGPQLHGISLLHSLPRDASGRLVKARLPLAQAVRASASAREVGPRTATHKGMSDAEVRLEPIWKELLGLEDVSHSASFFDLGGHSLLIVRLLARIEREFGQRISLADVYDNPTLSALARHLAGDEPAAAQDNAGQGDWRVTILSEEGDGVPLIAINNANLTFAMSRQMPTPRPALSLNIHDSTRGIELDRSLGFEEIATQYVDAVRSARPHGPYAFFGVCVHGNLAIEIARQLREQGEEVAAVILQDVWEPRYATRISTDPATKNRDRWHFLKVRLRMVWRGDSSLAAFLGTFRLFRESMLLKAAVRLRLVDRIRATDLTAEAEEYVAYLTDARNAHEPRPYDGRVLHIVTRDTPTGPGFDPTVGWSAIITGPMDTQHIDELYMSRKASVGTAEAAVLIDALLSEYDATGGQTNAQ